jgi:hypothetical protein
MAREFRRRRTPYSSASTGRGPATGGKGLPLSIVQRIVDPSGTIELSAPAGASGA